MSFTNTAPISIDHVNQRVGIGKTPTNPLDVLGTVTDSSGHYAITADTVNALSNAGLLSLSTGGSQKWALGLTAMTWPDGSVWTASGGNISTGSGGLTTSIYAPAVAGSASFSEATGGTVLQSQDGGMFIPIAITNYDNPTCSKFMLIGDGFNDNGGAIIVTSTGTVSYITDMYGGSEAGGPASGTKDFYGGGGCPLDTTHAFYCGPKNTDAPSSWWADAWKYDWNGNTWTALTSMPTAGAYYAINLNNGKIMVGGVSGSFYLYDITGNSWSTAASQSFVTTNHTYAQLLMSNGNLMVAGVIGVSTTHDAQIYNVSGNTWSSPTNNSGHTQDANSVVLVSLHDGNVLRWDSKGQAAYYNVSTNTWTWFNNGFTLSGAASDSSIGAYAAQVSTDQVLVGYGGKFGLISLSGQSMSTTSTSSLTGDLQFMTLVDSTHMVGINAEGSNTSDWTVKVITATITPASAAGTRIGISTPSTVINGGNSLTASEVIIQANPSKASGSLLQIENGTSLLYDFQTDHIDIGTPITTATNSAPLNANLRAYSTVTSNFGSAIAARVNVVTPSGTGDRAIGVYGEGNYNATSGTGYFNVAGGDFEAYTGGTKNVDNVTGVSAYAENDSSGTINILASLYGYGPTTSAGTVNIGTTCYLETAGGVGTASYGLFYEGATSGGPPTFIDGSGNIVIRSATLANSNYCLQVNSGGSLFAVDNTGKVLFPDGTTSATGLSNKYAAFASRPAAGNNGAQFIASDSPTALWVDDGTNWHPIVKGSVVGTQPKAASNFTHFGAGAVAATLADRNGTLHFSWASNTGVTSNLQGFYESLSSSTAHVEAAANFSSNLNDQSAYSTWGVAMRESSSAKAAVIMVMYSVPNTGQTWITTETWSSDSSRSTHDEFNIPAQASPVFVKLVRSGSNTLFQWSTDSQNWQTLQTTATATIFTTAPDQVAICSVQFTNGDSSGFDVLHYVSGT